jgi:hypothetical protein
MVVVAYNETLKAIDLMVDEQGADLLIQRLTKIKERSVSSHTHIDCEMQSPYGHETVYPEIVLQWIGN